MTREEKQKAIDALKTSAPVMAMTQEEFDDYIKTLNKIMDWLEQDSCEDVISREAVINLKWQGEASEEFLEGYVSAIEDARVLPSVKK